MMIPHKLVLITKKTAMSSEPTLREVLEQGQVLRQAFLDAQAKQQEAVRLYREAEVAFADWQKSAGPIAALLEVLK